MQPQENGGREQANSPPIQEPAKEGPAKTESKSSSAQLAKILERMTVQDRRKEHKFWSTQPVPQSAEQVYDATETGPFEENRAPALVRQEAFRLPSEFEWVTLDIGSSTELQEVYELLNSNYVEDYESMFRFDYSPAFLQWALMPPGWRPEWHLGVRVHSSRRLVAFIAATPALFSICEARVHAVEVNFLCVHKRLRDKRMTPMLIREVTRRVHIQGIFQALYTAGSVLPAPVARARYYHRPLSYRTLLETGFAMLPAGKTIEQMLQHYHLPKQARKQDLRVMETRHVSQVHQLLDAYLGRFHMRPVMSQAEIAHWLVPRANVINSYVLENDDGHVTDFVSFYELPSTVVDNALHQTIRVAYCFYYAVSVPETLPGLMLATLATAKQMGFDVFNCVEILDNASFFAELKFCEGDGFLHYYLYNWRTPYLEPSKVAVVML